MSKVRIVGRYILLFLLLGTIIFVSGCKEEKDADIERILSYTDKYSFINDGRNCINRALPMLCYYDDASYQAAKASADISTALAAEYFPSVKYESSGFTSVKMTAELEGLYLTMANESTLGFICHIRRSSSLGSTLYVYNVEYSRISDTIMSMEKIGTLL